jgi:uncharacterized RDD family membrane protein YckC
LRPNYTHTMEQQNDNEVLDNWKQDMYVDPVSSGVRFANFMIDMVVFIVIIFVLLFIGVMIAYGKGVKMPDLENLQYNTQVKIIDIVGTRILLIIYYTLYEGITKGRSFGKYATNTIVIKEDGTPFTFKDAFLRSLGRIIPFEPLSALGYRPWHDSLSKTAVVRKTW